MPGLQAPASLWTGLYDITKKQKQQQKQKQNAVKTKCGSF